MEIGMISIEHHVPGQTCISTEMTTSWVEMFIDLHQKWFALKGKNTRSHQGEIRVEISFGPLC
jgi:hypothetical protein